jgi:hypothetical protein
MPPPGRRNLLANGQACKAVEKFDLTTRPFLDEWITERSIDFIARSTATGTPFSWTRASPTFHPPLAVHPDFASSSGSPGAVPNNPGDL